MRTRTSSIPHPQTRNGMDHSIINNYVSGNVSLKSWYTAFDVRRQDQTNAFLCFWSSLSFSSSTRGRFTLISSAAFWTSRHHITSVAPTVEHASFFSVHTCVGSGFATASGLSSNFTNSRSRPSSMHLLVITLYF